MFKVKISKDKCKGCQLCVASCSKGLIKMDPRLNKRGVNFAYCDKNDQCVGCKFCAIICPDVCIEITTSK